MPDEPAVDIARRFTAIMQAATGAGDLDAAIADLHHLPADLALRGTLAAHLTAAMMRTDPLRSFDRRRHLDGLLEIADRDPPAWPGWPRVRSMAKALAIMRAARDDELADATAALAELDTLAAVAGAGEDPAVAGVFDGARGAVRFMVALRDDDLAGMRRPMDVENFRKLADRHPAVEPLADLIGGFGDLMAAHQRGDGAGDVLARLHQAADRLPPGSDARAALDDAMTAMAPLRAAFDASTGSQPTRPADDQVAAVVALAQRAGASPRDQARFWAAAGGAMLRDWQETDPERVGVAIDYLRSAVHRCPPGDPERPLHLVGLALGLLRHNELTSAVADLEDAAGLLTQAQRQAGHPQHPLWATITAMLTEVRRRRGGADTPTATALDGLRGHIWRVLTQSDLAAAHLVARDVASDAVHAARLCLADGDPAKAMQALDTGRALVLFTAIGLGDAASRLAGGRSDLASRWRAASSSGDPADLPADLRREVLAELSRQDWATGLLDPPALDEIQDALVALDADALVYLVPGARPLPGHAVIAPAAGPPSYLTLPGLGLDSGHDLGRYLDTLTGRDAALADPARDLSPPDDSTFRDRLDALCDWAWRAAMGPLLERCLPALPHSSTGRPPRVVLVPMGDLARVPWQAARRPADGRYAVELAAVSQAASARLLCHTGRLPPVRLAPVGLVVGDPDTGGAADELIAARAEARAIHRTFYRGGRYVGRRADGSTSPSGAGTAAQVRDWLASASPAAGAVLHLACHGFVAAGPPATTSYLLLAGAGKLVATELVELMGRSPDRAIGLVVLAACRTGQAMSGYDEAYSLGTAFLAGGARSVLSTQWSIPDRATSVLMFMFHHYLMVDRLPPWAALRQAQLWMLDPGRRPPDPMPARLRGQVADADLASIVNWAGFVHWGQ